MNRIFIYSFVVFLMAGSLAFGTDWDLPVMGLDEIEPGMQGVGRTVYYGQTIEEFQVEILDIVRNQYPDFDIILARLAGEQAEKNGVVSGMSGSPVYIDGKLIGAIAYRMGTFLKEPITGIMPIENMLRLDKLNAHHSREWKALNGFGNRYLQACLSGGGDSLWIDLLSQAASTRSVFAPIETPLVFSGIQPEFIEPFQDVLSKMGFTSSAGGTRVSLVDSAEVLQPGSAVSTVLIAGDAGIAATGTVTAVSDGKLLAFGHPVFSLGAINLPLYGARIHWTVPSLMGSNKMATPTQLLGVFRQDRMSGVLGDLNEMPQWVPVSLQTQSPYGEDQQFEFKMAWDPSLNHLLPFYLRIALVQALNVSRYAGGQHSVRLKGFVELVSGEKIEFDDLFSSNQRFGYSATGTDFVQASDLVTSALGALMINDFEAPRVKRVELETRTLPGKWKTRIESIWLDKTTVEPGDTVFVTVSLRDTRERRSTIIRPLVIPRHINARRASILVGGGLYLAQYESKVNRELFVPHSFDDLLRILEERRKPQNLALQLRGTGNHLVVEGQRMLSVPPSVMNVMDNRGRSQNGARLHDYAYLEDIVELDQVVYGIKRHVISIEPTGNGGASGNQNSNR
ncbi:MAG: SpoIVB peptidase S55 domain-containing protein [candidate division KSB1 bacterium]|nr:SpoIVB peptidase S55 domain-containing protein [candidate division KSB1 bacterium]